MDNFSHAGNVLTLTAPSGGVVSGLAKQIGSLVVIATKTVAQTLPFPALAIGVVDVVKEVSEAWTEGMKVYWDIADAAFTKDPDTATNALVGVALGPIVDSVVTLASNDTDMTVAGLAVTIVDYTSIAGKTITVTVNGVATVLTEGVEFSDATGNNETATSLAAAITLVDGVTATASSAIVTAVAATGIAVGSPAVGRVRLDGAAR